MFVYDVDGLQINQTAAAIAMHADVANK